MGRLKAQLDLERTGWSHFLRRFFQTFWKTLRTGAKISKIVEIIYAGIVAIAPGEVKCIIAHGLNADSLQTCWNAAVGDLAHAGKLLNASGAHTLFPQEPRRIGAEVPVAPDNISLSWTHPFYKFGL